VDYYQENGPSTFARTTLLHGNYIFGMEGYLALLVGQKVHYRDRHVPTPEEWCIWNGIRTENRIKALTALTVRRALDAISSRRSQWVPGYFKHQAAAAPPPVQLTSYIGEV
jgi:tryptophan halogenase